MTSNVSNLPEHVPALPLEARAAPPPDDPVATQLRGFGPLGLLSILVIVLTFVVKPTRRPFGASVGLAIAYAMARHRLRATKELDWQPRLRRRLRLRVEPPDESDRDAAAGRPRNQFRLPLRDRKPGCAPRIGVHDDCRRGLWRRDYFPRIPIRTPRQAFWDWRQRKSINRAAHLRGVCPGPLRQPGASRRRTGDDHGPRLRSDLRRHGPDLDGDVRACCVRSNGGRDNLLESRSRCRSPRVQIAAGLPNNTLQSSYRKPLTMHKRRDGTRQSRAPLRAVAGTRAPAERPVSLDFASCIISRL